MFADIILRLTLLVSVCSGPFLLWQGLFLILVAHLKWGGRGLPFPFRGAGRSPSRGRLCLYLPLLPFPQLPRPLRVFIDSLAFLPFP